MRRTFFLLLTLAGLSTQAQNPVQLELVPWAQNITKVVDLAHCGDSRLFAVRQAGVIVIITDSMTVLPTPFLNITSLLNTGSERGLLGLAFDPDYATNGHFYVYYTFGSGSGSCRISRFTVSADPNVADPASRVDMYEWTQPYSNHNGGGLLFGPDGNLYLGLGDGGSAGDPQDNGQDLSNPLGTIIRIHPESDGSWTVPADNPFANAVSDTLPEIWAFGLRNPWRFGFDALTGDVWIGDVGQNKWEEVDFWPGGNNDGPNFGWRCFEGNAVYNNSGCGPFSDYVPPVAVHNNVANGGPWCSVIGGRVYRGSVFPRLYGRYIYTDYCAGQFWSLLPNGSGGWVNQNLLSSGLAGFASIIEGPDGELYACNESNNRVYKIKDKCPMDPPVITVTGSGLESSPASSYVWYVDGVAIPGSNSQTWVPTSPGNYHVVGNMGNGCLLASDTVMNVMPGFLERMNEGFSMMPNPARDEVWITMPVNAGPDVRVELLDASGRVVRDARPGSDGRVMMRTADLMPGTYAVVLRSGAQRVAVPQRLVVAR
ncbi:MAG: PQQ-dependent sugar dehydrogenase [Flavobacteriales bacterium]|nr:PQQ-dependent sugar dehydrogenase [Flavobacteriales bacterium]